MPRKLTEKQAWREIARRIAEGEWWVQGLCREIVRLVDSRLVSRPTYDRMWDTLDQYNWIPDPDDGEYYEAGYLFPPGEGEVRVLAALLLAELS